MGDYQGDLKQEIIRSYNQVNQKLFNIGTKWVRVEFLGRYILILAKHRRLPASLVMDRKMPVLSRMFDMVLLDDFKENLQAELNGKLGLKIACILKDYNPQNELAGTIIVLDDTVS